MASYQHLEHPWPPYYDEQSKVLILGTFPSPKSRERGFYYGHPQNRFWRVAAQVLDYTPIPQSIVEKKQFLSATHIALWDVIKSCDIVGASDSSIKNACGQELGPLLATTEIETIFTTGKTAQYYYEKLCLPETGITSIYLPSTSPANCAHYPWPALLTAWQELKNALAR